jgi:hypothetical protein
MPEKSHIIDEHFWFTATTLGVNAFLMSSKLAIGKTAILTVSSVVSLFAIFLVVHRANVHAGTIEGVPGSGLKYRWRNTRRKFVGFFPGLVFIIIDFSGALFYLLLIVISCCGVWVTQLTTITQATCQ